MYKFKWTPLSRITWFVPLLNLSVDSFANLRYLNTKSLLEAAPFSKDVICFYF